MTQARAAGTGALLLIVASVGASVQTDLAVSRHRDGGCGIGVAFGGGCLRLRQAHRSFRSEGKARRQACQQNTQHKAHDGISFFAVIRCEKDVRFTTESRCSATAVR
jgi:uncharacterized ParB-like nuclease family protein